ncbi:MAG: hypothetical protein WBP13_04800 [Methylophilaceae bacterium]
MSKMIYPVLLSAVLSLSACASLNAPSTQNMAKIPVVTFGETTTSDHIMLYPAGANLPVIASVKGSIFEKTDEATLNVKLKKDLYTYKNWVSFDGKTWIEGNKVVGGNVSMVLPGEKDGQNSGTLSAEFNLK